MHAELAESSPVRRSKIRNRHYTTHFLLLHPLLFPPLLLRFQHFTTHFKLSGSTPTQTQRSTALKMSQSKRKPSDNDIDVKVKSQDGRELFFRINKSTSLQKLLTAYCKKMNIDDHHTLLFLYNGVRTNKKTPEQLGMEDGAEIEALHYNMGGGCKGL